MNGSATPAAMSPMMPMMTTMICNCNSHYSTDIRDTSELADLLLAEFSSCWRNSKVDPGAMSSNLSIELYTSLSSSPGGNGLLSPSEIGDLSLSRALYTRKVDSGPRIFDSSKVRGVSRLTSSANSGTKCLWSTW